MSDVSSFTSLKARITADPYYEIIDNSVKKIIEKYGHAVKGNRLMAKEAIHYDDLLNPEYRAVGKSLGPERIGKFKNNITRRLKCFIAVDQNRTITGWSKVHWPCNCKSCPLCSARKAIERLRYPETIIMVGEHVGDRDDAVSEVKEMNQVLEAMDIHHLPVTTIPTHDGRNIILVACLRMSELNPLLDRNQVKDDVDFLKREYPWLTDVEQLDSDHKFEKVYRVIQTGTRFTTTELFQTMPEGNSTIRERGRRPGFYFDAETGQIAHMTKAERQKKTDDDEGVICKFNVPSASSELPTNVKTIAARRTIARTSAHHERAAYFAETSEDAAYQIKRWSSVYIEELEAQGYTQPDVQTSVRLTQKEVDNFMSQIAIPKAGDLPRNILDIEFTGLDRKTYGLRDQYNKIKENLMADAQRKLRENLTHQELADMIIEQIEVKPPG